MLSIEDEVDYEPQMEELPKLQMNLHYALEKSSNGVDANQEEGNVKMLLQREKERRKWERESDEKVLASRQKQIDYGKNTIGYHRYVRQIPRRKRRREDPWTPDKYQICSKRSWDGQVRKWRRLLHSFDPVTESAPQAEAPKDADSNELEEILKAC